MRAPSLLVLALVLPVVLAGAQAGRPCDSGGLIGLRFVPFPAPVPTPLGRMATGVYVDDRAHGTILGVVPSPLGWLVGDGTWAYWETNGVEGLQRGDYRQGDFETLLHNPLAGSNGEFDYCAVPDGDEDIV